jgi:putative photosynthetic complex assembly protein
MSAVVAPFPRLPLFAVASILGGALLVSTAARLVGFAAAPAAGPVPLAATSLNFSDQPDGSVAVIDATTGRLIETVAPRAGGFLRSTMRVLATERAADGIGPKQPFDLAAFPGNRLVLTDTATGQRLELEAFGPSNAAEFAEILKAAEAGQ